MCLAVPMKIMKRTGECARVESSGVSVSVELALTPEAKVGDYVLVHAGYALTVIDESEARKTLELLRELGELSE